MTEKLAKIKSMLGPDTVEGLDALDGDGLKGRLVQSRQAIRDAKEGLEKNPAYQQAKQDVKDLSAGFRDVKRRQDALGEYCLFLLEEKGKA